MCGDFLSRILERFAFIVGKVQLQQGGWTQMTISPDYPVLLKIDYLMH